MINLQNTGNNYNFKTNNPAFGLRVQYKQIEGLFASMGERDLFSMGLASQLKRKLRPNSGHRNEIRALEEKAGTKLTVTSVFKKNPEADELVIRSSNAFTRNEKGQIIPKVFAKFNRKDLNEFHPVKNANEVVKKIKEVLKDIINQ